MKERSVVYLNYLLLFVILGALALWFFYRERPEEYPYFCDDRAVICDLERAPYRDASRPLEERVEDLLSHMTLEEKIGQLALVEQNNLNPEDIGRYGFGGLLSGGGSHPAENTPAGWQSALAGYQDQILKTRLKIPLLYGVDAVHGHGNIPEATVFPHQIGLGAANDPELVRRVNEATAKELAATGVNWNFSPSLDVPKDQRWGRVYENFGSDGARVAELAGPAVRGLQGDDPAAARLIATAKHYVGAGAMAWGTSVNKDYKIDQGETRLAEEELRAEHLPAFQAAVEAGVWSVMAGLNSYQGRKLSAHDYLLTNVLKEELGFSGFVVSDWYGVYEIPGSDYLNTVTAINAGVDMVMLPYDYKKFAADMRQAVENGRIPPARLDDAVRRILRAKFAAGLFDRSAPEAADLLLVGSREHRELAREAVRRSQVVLKNNNRLLPLRKDEAKILVAGSAADNTGRQAGGWTIDWQGGEGNRLPGATSILAGIHEAVSPETEIVFEEAGNFPLGERAEIGIAVVGERPYAEGFGDEERPRLSAEDLLAISRLRQLSRRVVVIVVSGRALDIKEIARSADAIVAAWLPGSEGQGVADVLFGDHPFTGTLPVPWEL